MSDAVIRLRQAVAGAVAGVSRQSELFRDPLGHATQPTVDLVSHIWLACLYRQSPIGLKALDDPNDPDSAARQAVLQDLAWRSVLDDPLSGVAIPT